MRRPVSLSLNHCAVSQQDVFHLISRVHAHAAAFGRLPYLPLSYSCNLYNTLIIIISSRASSSIWRQSTRPEQTRHPHIVEQIRILFTDIIHPASAHTTVSHGVTTAPFRHSFQSASVWDCCKKKRYVSWMGYPSYIASSQTTGLALFDIKFRGEQVMYELGLQEAMAQYAGDDPLQGGQE